MIKFRLGRIPVQVHFSHVLFLAVLGLGWPPVGHGGWIPAAIENHKSAQHDQAVMIWAAIFVVMGVVSVLFHELGHAVVSLAFGYKPDVELRFMGGVTRTNANETVPWLKSVTLTIAGPLFGMLLGLVGIFVTWAIPDGTFADSVAATFVAMNLVWAVFNLAPIYPLDGGQIVSSVLQRVFGRPGFLYAQLISLFTLGVLALIMISLLGLDPWNAFLVILFAIGTITNIQRYMRGELPAQPNHPSELAYKQAVDEYQAGRLDRAKDLGEKALSLDMTPALRARFHYMLGWIAVKAGEGRIALDHFSQVQGQKVEPQALGAAFSLIGDEGRALPLWELAYRETQDPTILHEWAGSLIRAGRDSDARRIHGVEMATAYRCAERLLFIRGEFQQAAEVGLKGLDERPSANTAYDVACAFARAGDKEAAIRLLQRAMELGFRDAEYASSDSDLTSLHGHPAFTALLNALRKNAALT
ncbi:MAG: M50 family metallopeptidase [Myxococcaceae bacterium]